MSICTVSLLRTTQLQGASLLQPILGFDESGAGRRVSHQCRSRQRWQQLQRCGTMENTLEVRFDAQGLPNGTYFYRLEAENHKEAKKMVLLK
jgi:hypothetical protein